MIGLGGTRRVAERAVRYNGDMDQVAHGRTNDQVRPASVPASAPDLATLTAGRQDPDVEPLTFDEVLWVRDRVLAGRLIGPAIVLQLVEAYFEARGSRTSR